MVSMLGLEGSQSRVGEVTPSHFLGKFSESGQLKGRDCYILALYDIILLNACLIGSVEVYIESVALMGSDSFMTLPFCSPLFQYMKITRNYISQTSQHRD